MSEKIRYGVVGLGHIAQTAILPAFNHAKKNSVLGALISSDKTKLEQLGARYGVYNCYSYSEYVDCLESGEIDAVYISTPNTLHHYFAGLALQRGIHVLCEMPLANDEKTCRSLIEIAEKSGAKLMVGYRLHFDPANLEAIEIVKAGKIGDLKIFHAIFTAPVRDRNNFRLKRNLGGGPLFDLGIYCINSARNLFQAEPVEVVGMATASRDSRFQEIDESAGAIVKFPGGKLGVFSVNFSGKKSAAFELIGSKGAVRLENAFEYNAALRLSLIKEAKTLRKRFERHDQFGAELIYFSDCIQRNQEPEPSGWEGLADVRVIEAIAHSVRSGVSVALESLEKHARPSMSQRISLPPVRKIGREIHANSPQG